MEDSSRDIVLRLERLEQAVRSLEALVEQRLLPECERMGGHISFVESVYAKLRNPLAALRGAPLPTAPAAAVKNTGGPGPCVVEEVD
jgi:hypothetical protein